MNVTRGISMNVHREIHANVPRRLRSTTVLWMLVLLLVAVCAFSLMLGSTRLSALRVLAAVVGRGDYRESLIVLSMRLPRLVLSVLIGAGLAVSGVILQGITRNHLASPDTLGVNAGSGLGIMLLLTVWPTAATQSPVLLPLAATAGAAVFTALVFALAYRRGTVLPARLLLVGVAVGFGAHAAMLMFSLRMSFSMYSYVSTWMSGTLAGGSWVSIRLLLPWPVVLLPLVWMQARTLDVLTLGEYVAAGLGVPLQRQRLRLIAAATILTSVCVAIGGQIGFLGLAAPHLARRLVGRRHRVLLPAAAAIGATLLLLGDSLGRHLLAPAEIPAGVAVGILGGLYFLYLLATTKG
jgi:iron complex transport system permease protein